MSDALMVNPEYPMVIHHGLPNNTHTHTHNVFGTLGGPPRHIQIIWMHACIGLGTFGLTSRLGRARLKPPKVAHTLVSPHLVVTPLPPNIVSVYPAQPSPVARRHTRNGFLTCCCTTLPLSQAHKPPNVTHVHPERLIVGHVDMFFSSRATDDNQMLHMSWLERI